MFDKGQFAIHFSGHQASGKTVALNKIREFLKAEGYNVQDRTPVDQTHTLEVSWSK